MSPLAAIALVTLLIPGAPPNGAVPRHGPLLSAALAIQPVQHRTPQPIGPSPVHVSRRVRAALIGGFIGAAAGGTIGYVMTKDCRCDDPGAGLLLGLPVGALAGAVIGAAIGGK
jgi:hypothetical protein